MTQILDECKRELEREQERLAYNQPHKCSKCSWFACNPELCQCQCGRLVEFHERRIEWLNRLIALLESGEIVGG